MANIANKTITQNILRAFFDPMSGNMYRKHDLLTVLNLLPGKFVYAETHGHCATVCAEM